MTIMKIEAVKAEHEARIMLMPNVVGIGVGEKAGKSVITIFVTRKVSKLSLQSHEIIPKVLEGYETDVEEIGAVAAQL